MAEFFFSTCKSAGLNSSVFLRNTARSGNRTSEKTKVALSVFREGVLIHQENMGELLPNGFLEVMETEIRNKIEVDKGDTSELLFSFTIKKVGDQADTFFPQEHQINYMSLNGQGFTSLLYDQMPITAKPTSSPIILLAPKIWMYPEREVYLVISNRNLSPESQDRDLKFGIFSERGECLTQWTFPQVNNSAKVIPIHTIVEKNIYLENRCSFYNLFGFGGSSTSALYTITKDRLSGAMAIEHSLSPHYYFNGDRARVRKDLENFEWPQIREQLL